VSYVKVSSPFSGFCVGVICVYPTGGQQVIDWAHRVLVDGVNPPQWLVLLFDQLMPAPRAGCLQQVQLPERGSRKPRSDRKRRIVLTAQPFNRC
jgi:hypothetical protein